MFRNLLLPIIVWVFYFLLSSSWRKKLIIAPDVQSALDSNTPIILAHWHGDELAVLHLVKPFQLATMTSTSKDGELIDFVSIDDAIDLLFYKFQERSHLC